MALHDYSELNEAAEMLRRLLGLPKGSCQGSSIEHSTWKPFLIEANSELKTIAQRLPKLPTEPAVSRRKMTAQPTQLPNAERTGGARGLTSPHTTKPPLATAPLVNQPKTEKAPLVEPLPVDRSIESVFTSDRLSALLEAMCRRGGFNGGVIADGSGLLLADYNCPVEAEAVAACGSVLGGAMEQAGALLGQNEASTLSFDINYVDKVALHRFNLERDSFFLMVICPQSVDERSEIEVSIEQIRAILSLKSAHSAFSPSNPI